MKKAAEPKTAREIIGDAIEIEGNEVQPSQNSPLYLCQSGQDSFDNGAVGCAHYECWGREEERSKANLWWNYSRGP